MRPIPGIGVTLDPGSGTKSTGGVIGAADATIRADDRPFMIVGATASCAAFAVTDDAAGSRLKRQVSEWTCRSYLHRLFEATGQTGQERTCRITPQNRRRCPKCMSLRYIRTMPLFTEI